ncbi:MAG: tyrosine-type recombinase/integrase [Lachnospiraceae bacterium]|nr:tyrosine-type recombinase/integrase [Lachnospiraceae bacterium]
MALINIPHHGDESRNVHICRSRNDDACDESQKPQRFYEVGYTRDEKNHPHNGRFIPITKEARKVIEEAYKIPGSSDYLFHEKNSSDPIKKGSYCQNLRKRTQKLGTLAHNNHAFRMSFNTRLINMGFSPSDRALILGHEVQTNESHYSLTDKRRLNDIKNRLDQGIKK